MPASPNTLASGYSRHDLGQHGVHVAVAAALAQCRRTANDNLRGTRYFAVNELLDTGSDLADSLGHAVGRQFSIADHLSCEFAIDFFTLGSESAETLLDKRLTFLEDEQRIAGVVDTAHIFFGKRILADFNHREWAVSSKAFHQIVVCYS